MANPLKCPGGKTPLAARIAALVPPGVRYAEPFLGGAAVALALLRRGDLKDCLLTDANFPLVTFWQVLRRPAGLAYLKQHLPTGLPTREEFDQARQKLSAVGSKCTLAAANEVAAAYFVCNRASRAANMMGYLTTTSRQRRGMDEHLAAWQTAAASLEPTHRLLQSAAVVHRDAFSLLQQVADDAGRLVYLDPPYPHSVRHSHDYYAHEMSDADHERLIDMVKKARCKVLLSSYHNPLYDRELKSWELAEFPRANSMAAGKVKRTMVECVWRNYE